MMKQVQCSRCEAQLQVPQESHSAVCLICRTVIATNNPDSHHTPPSPYNHAPPGPPPQVNGKKRAVICGISYRNTDKELEGSINDAKFMKYLLSQRFNFPHSSILMLTDEETDPSRQPTKQNIRLAFQWLVQGCQAGDSLVFHFSGHGAQERNFTGDEADGYDETICPVDFDTRGMIFDDEINATIVKPLPHGVKLHAIVDACHSGTVLDLPFLCKIKNNEGKYKWKHHRSKVQKGTSGGLAISFSSCHDNQTSSDTSALAKTTSTGAMTFSLIEAIENGDGATYGSILNSVRSTLDHNFNALHHRVLTSVINIARGGHLRLTSKQIPQLTASEPFDIYAKPFSL